MRIFAYISCECVYKHTQIIIFTYAITNYLLLHMCVKCIYVYSLTGVNVGHVNGVLVGFKYVCSHIAIVMPYFVGRS